MSAAVAQTILDQIKHGRAYDGHGGNVALACWGATKFQAHPENPGRHLGALRFWVRGRKHTGYVFVMLAYDDTYTIQIARFYKNEWRVKREVEGVYCDQLTEIIDALVESKDAEVA